MAALVAPGAPVSALIDYGLPESVAAKLVEAGVGTVEKLGGMTPEELEAIPGIDLEAVEQLGQSVNAYYSQFEDPATQAAEAGEAEAPEAEPQAGEAVAVVDAEPAESPEAEPQDGEPVVVMDAADYQPAEAAAELEAEGAALAEAREEQSGTMEGAGSPTENSETAGNREDASGNGE
jgi:N utilization substance protein A